MCTSNVDANENLGDLYSNIMCIFLLLEYSINLPNTDGN